MDYYIKLNTSGLFNANFRARKKVIKIWREVESVFKDYHLYTYALGEKCSSGYKITIDASDVVSFFESRIKKVRLDDFLEYKISPEMYLKVTLKGFNGSELLYTGGSRGVLIINRYLHDLFLAINFCNPSLDLWRGEILDSSYELINYTPDLSLQPIYNAWTEGKKWKYPRLSSISFVQAWEWINNIKLPGTGLANTSSQKASILLLDLCSSSKFGVENILTLSRGFEVIFVTPSEGITRALKERIEIVLGTPISNKKWLTSFYNTRSRIIHGDFPVTRNSFEYDLYTEEFVEEFEGSYYTALAVYLSILQIMIRKNSDGFSFKQRVELIKFNSANKVKGIE